MATELDHAHCPTKYKGQNAAVTETIGPVVHYQTRSGIFKFGTSEPALVSRVGEANLSTTVELQWLEHLWDHEN